MRTFAMILSILCYSLAGSAQLSVNEEAIFSLNDVTPELCSQEANGYTQGTPGFYACERARKVLYSQAADLSQVENGDPEKPPVNVLGPEVVPEGVNVLRSYVVEPPLQNKPEPGKKGPRGIDWSRADALVRSAARNLLQPVRDDEGQVVTYADGSSVPNHGISHAFMELKCEGLRPILTGMTTGKDIEAPLNFFVHNLGLGILFRTQVGRLNSYEELSKEIAIRKEKAGDLVFVDYKLNKENCRYVYYSVVELVAEGIQKRYGSLTDRMMNGTGMGCAMFDVGVKQMAGLIPIYENILSPSEKEVAISNAPCDFHHQWNRTIYVPKSYLPTPMEDGSLEPAEVGILSFLLSGDDVDAFLYWGKFVVTDLVNLVKGKVESVEGAQELKEELGEKLPSKEELGNNPIYLILSKGMEAVSNKLDSPFGSFAAKAALLLLQTSLDGRVIINEELKPRHEGYSFDDSPNADNETLSFWDPQLFATWTRDVHDELQALSEGSVENSEIRCYDQKQAHFKRKTEGKLVGLEVDWTQRMAPSESIFLRYDKERSFSNEDVDPFKAYDGNPNTLPAIFNNVIKKAMD